MNPSLLHRIIDQLTSLFKQGEEIKSSVSNLTIDADTINLNTDNLEQLSQDQIDQLQTILTDIDSIDTKVSTSAKQDITNTKLQAIIDNGISATVDTVGIKDILDAQINPAKEDGNLATIAGKDFATTAKQDLLLAELQLKADLTETQPVSLAAIPLATDAATATKQDTGNSSLSSIKTNTDKLDIALTSLRDALKGLNNKDFSTLETALGALLTELQLKADLTETQPVSGTVTANAGTNLNTSALALETTLSAVKTAVEIIDNAIAGSEMQVDVIALPADIDIRDLNSTQDSVEVKQATGTNLHTVVDSGTISLPSNASTLTEQQTQSTSLGSIKTNTDKLDIALTTLRDALKGASAKDFTTVQSALDIITSAIQNNIHTGTPELNVYSEGHVCTPNSTTTPLGISGIFTGSEWQDVLDYSEVIVSINADQDSAADGLEVQWSSQGTLVDETDVFTITANQGKTFSFPCNRRYVRIKYTNGTVAQTLFDLQTLAKRFASKGSSHRLKDNLVQEDDAIVTKSMIAGFTTAGGGAVVNVKVNPSGAIQVGGTLDSVTTLPLPTGAATSAKQDTLIANQTNNTQTTQIVDSGGEAVTVTGNKLDVNATVTASGLPTNAAQEAGGNLAAILAQAILLVAKDFATQTTLNSFSSKLTTEVHVRVHSGVYFHSGHNATLNTSGTLDILIVTDPAAVKKDHFFLEIFAFNGNNNKAFTVNLYEDTTVSVNGTSVPVYNLNRSSATVATTTVFHTPTVTGVGSQIMNQRTGLKEFKLVVRPGEEYDLKTNSNYLIRITSLINNNDIQANLGWYEL